MNKYPLYKIINVTQLKYPMNINQTKLCAKLKEKKLLRV